MGQTPNTASPETIVQAECTELKEKATVFTGFNPLQSSDHPTHSNILIHNFILKYFYFQSALIHWYKLIIDEWTDSSGN